MSTTAQATRSHARDVLMLRAMALGFGIGSTLFAAGTLLIWLTAPALAANVTYAVGAVCFTSAAAVQWRASVWHHPERQSMRRRAETDWTNADWSSAIVQLIGTLFFNVMTIRAVQMSLGADVTAPEVWKPDAIGSLLFLISSFIALHPVSRQRRHALVTLRSWWICWANMSGSILFGVSAWGSSVGADGLVRSEFWSNWGTFLGAIGFLLASLLLWPAPRPGQAAEPVI